MFNGVLLNKTDTFEYSYYGYQFDLVSKAIPQAFYQHYDDWHFNFTSYYNPFIINSTSSVI